MKLLIDIGNTRLKWAWVVDGKLGPQGSVLTSEVGVNPPKKLTAEKLATKGLEVWISSVASRDVLSRVVDSWFASSANFQTRVIEAGSCFEGFSNEYADLSKLGVDRWVAVIGARSVEPSGDLIVVDAGTAVTVDWLDANNAFQGGAIIPGAGLMHDALVGNTAGIESEFQNTRQIVGKDTIECVNSGVTYGLVGAIDNVIQEMKKVIDQPVKVLLSGGAATALSSRLKSSHELNPDLVLLGLLAMSL